MPKKTAEAVLVALELHEDLPKNGVGATAAEFGLSRRTLQAALRHEGATYREIIRGVRLRRAMQLLATTDMTLAEVALRAGYTDPSNFSRAFQSLCGVTPGQFRATARSVDSLA